jgi:hypothetical protein
MTVDHQVRQLSKSAGRATSHYAIANCLTGRAGKQPLCLSQCLFAGKALPDLPRILGGSQVTVAATDVP